VAVILGVIGVGVLVAFSAVQSYVPVAGLVVIYLFIGGIVCSLAFFCRFVWRGVVVSFNGVGVILLGFFVGSPLLCRDRFFEFGGFDMGMG
jgi:hypothetical protein